MSELFRHGRLFYSRVTKATLGAHSLQSDIFILLRRNVSTYYIAWQQADADTRQFLSVALGKLTGHVVHSCHWTSRVENAACAHCLYWMMSRHTHLSHLSTRELFGELPHPLFRQSYALATSELLQHIADALRYWSIPGA